MFLKRINHVSDEDFFSPVLSKKGSRSKMQHKTKATQSSLKTHNVVRQITLLPIKA